MLAKIDLIVTESDRPVWGNDWFTNQVLYDLYDRTVCMTI